MQSDHFIIYDINNYTTDYAKYFENDSDNGSSVQMQF